MGESLPLEPSEQFAAVEARLPITYYAKGTLEHFTIVKELIAADAATRARFVEYAIDRILSSYEASNSRGPVQKTLTLQHNSNVAMLVGRLMKSKLPIAEEKMLSFVLRLGVFDELSPHSLHFLTPLASWLEAPHYQAVFTDDHREALARMANAVNTGWVSPERRKLMGKLLKLANIGQPPLQPGEVWSNAVYADLKTVSAEVRQAWIDLLLLCTESTSGSPSAKWPKAAAVLVDKLGFAEFTTRLTHWLPLVDKPKPVGANQPPAQHFRAMELDASNGDVLKGLVWACVPYDDADLARLVSALAISTYKKIPGVGPRSPKVGNAAVWTLGHMPGQLGLAQLAILKVRVKYGTAQRLIEKAFEETAERLGLPRAEIEELTVPTYGLDEVGYRRETLGEFTAELIVASDGSCELKWLKADGKAQKSVPAALKTDFAEELKDLKSAAKDLQQMVTAQKERLDSLFLAQRSWPVAIWRERYLDHPLVGILARRLVWLFQTGEQKNAGCCLNETIVGVDDQPLSLAPETTVELWHPIGRSLDEVLAWRNWFTRHQIQQPFKQAHREVYLLTDAELRTATYSNRYAAHILRQHQFNALCHARGWKNKLRLMVDDSYTPASRSLSQWNLRAEFWVEGAGQEYGVDTNDTGTYLYLATDQVRFYPIDAAPLEAHASGGGYSARYLQTADEPLPLTEVPALVFSEIMRDVDLFVGVASVGNDPGWSDGGPTGRYLDYWQQYSFGELTATAHTRKEILAGLLPRLKIGPQCSFEDRFLIVQGSLRTYKIHLGSGNILMEPGNQYLCIVPRQTTTSAGKGKDKMFLPFEGDNMLSIILSKALLLAEDKKITDRSITSQIGKVV